MVSLVPEWPDLGDYVALVTLVAMPDEDEMYLCEEAFGHLKAMVSSRARFWQLWGPPHTPFNILRDDYDAWARHEYEVYEARKESL